METKSMTMIGLAVKFKAVKEFNPNAGKECECYGIITNYIENGFWGVKYSYPDGEYCQSRVHSSRLTSCETPSEKHLALASATGWALAEQETILGRMVYYNKKGDRQSVDNLIRKNKEINFILNIK